MDFEHIDIIPAPVDEVYVLVREKLPELAEFLPNIRSIEQLSYQNLDEQKTEIVNLWKAQVSIPTMLKSIVNEDMFSWKDIATWYNHKMEVHYSLIPNIGEDFFSAEGRNLFERGENSKETKLKVFCKLEIHPEKISALPGFLSSHVKPVLESLVSKIVEPNMTSLGMGLKKYLNQKKYI